ncbi:Retrovirus-related Pol polyprotein from type-1 retrotransposable element R1 2 [Gossypium arboreum]|uniref:Retrovirus-related Pol polyprotein from type-1 retrotransposable element R1 2 n=1 Tax=Gossypium arboreum TaxID=29729 RepID=A0A0B0NAB9_GOSAR|nr:Retrovirus-related Pol polyprotein from type-1 retrotransposable element R1 2 [Gossypium arboreum]KHG16807.1 Retrovirus-related Pol polyprotein from type-1 retrotransposable element R1 2 [Gossypium arboreum]KHG23698.1 Retrovirus-related Pol polyprotein from type-1 retrotransposable element R1 2 [Gossypium arboreum]KHG30576.1 Retrovirus-related Pol polyprotein from type-1 retrotransposable element R1 2 [Gossypium arboreum]
MRNAFPGLKLQCAMHNQVISEPSPAVLKHVGHKFHEVFQLKQACYADLPVTKILEMMESNSLESAPTQALLNVVYGILDETAETMNGKIPHHVACLLRKAVQEMGQRLSTQADHLRTQNNLYRAHEEKHRSKIKELEALVSVSRKETKVHELMKQKHVTVQPQQIRSRRKKNISWFSASTLLKCFRPTSQA